MHFDTQTLLDALRVTVLGMGLVFVSLGLLMLVMGGLGRIFRPASPKFVATAVAPVEAPTPSDERRRVAAIALALVHRRRQAGAAGRGRRRQATDAWVAWGRTHQMETRLRRGGGERHR